MAVAHYCEGAGHASRMLAVTRALETAGYETVLAGGGPGRTFVERNGYREYEPTPVDLIDGYQRGNPVTALAGAAPALTGRVRDYAGWLRRERPAFLVADDISAAVAATLTRTPYYYLTHDPAGFYTTTAERVGARVRNRFAVATAELFALPKVWTGAPTIPGAEVVPPIAPAGGALDASVDVLVVPSAFTVSEDRLRTALERRGRSVTLVGGDDWTVAPSLQPYIERATVVVCSGYSTVMEAAVAGTPCIVLPHTSEQRGVVRALADDVGFYAAASVDDVVSLLDRVEAPTPRPNGVDRFVELVVEHAGR